MQSYHWFVIILIWLIILSVSMKFVKLISTKQFVILKWMRLILEVLRRGALDAGGENDEIVRLITDLGKKRIGVVSKGEKFFKDMGVGISHAWVKGRLEVSGAEADIINKAKGLEDFFKNGRMVGNILVETQVKKIELKEFGNKLIFFIKCCILSTSLHDE